jgi:hypothetical protein
MWCRRAMGKAAAAVTVPEVLGVSALRDGQDGNACVLKEATIRSRPVQALPSGWVAQNLPD